MYKLDNRETAARKYDGAVHPRENSEKIQIHCALGVSGRHPFQKMVSRDEQAAEGTHNRVQHQPGLISKKDNRQSGLSGS